MVSMRLGCSPRGRARQIGQDKFSGPHYPVNLGVTAESDKAFGWWGRTLQALQSLCFKVFRLAEAA